MGNGLLVYRPVEYFRGFESRKARLWVALGAFLVSSLAEVTSVRELPPAGQAWLALLDVMLSWAFGILFFGVLWFFVGARLLGGKAALGMTLKAVGYAFLVPALVALAVSVVTAGLGEQAPSTAASIVGVKVGLCLYALCLAGIAVKFTHSLTWTRAALVVLWMPAVWLALAAAIIFVVPLFGMMRTDS